MTKISTCSSDRIVQNARKVCEEKLESKCSSAKVFIMKGNLVLSTELIT